MSLSSDENPRSALPRIILISDRKRAPLGLHRALELALRALPEDSLMLILREKDLPAPELLRLSSELLPMLRKHRGRLLVSGRMDVALAAGADGVHLGKEAPPFEQVRRALPPHFLIGVSLHAAQALPRLEPEPKSHRSEVFPLSQQQAGLRQRESLSSSTRGSRPSATGLSGRHERNIKLGRRGKDRYLSRFSEDLLWRASLRESSGDSLDGIPEGPVGTSEGFRDGSAEGFSVRSPSADLENFREVVDDVDCSPRGDLDNFPDSLDKSPDDAPGHFSGETLEHPPDGISQGEFESEGERFLSDAGFARIPDYVLYSPIFPTASKPGATPLGLPGLSEGSHLHQHLPLYALGGVTPSNAGMCLKAGAYGVAVLSSVLCSQHPDRAAEALWQALQNARSGLLRQL